MYIFVRARSDPIELVQVGLLDLVQYGFVVVAVIALAGRIDLFFQCVVEIRLRDLAFCQPALRSVREHSPLREPDGVKSDPLT